MVIKVKKYSKIFFNRLVIVGFFMFLQLFAIVIALLRFNQYFIYFTYFTNILAVVVLLKIINRDGNPSYKIAWLVPVLAFPIVGVPLYLMFAGNRTSPRTQRKMNSISQVRARTLAKTLREKIAFDDPDAAAQSTYIEDHAGCPVFDGNKISYYPIGDVMLSPLVQDIERAERYVFLEYFIIEEGKMWSKIYKALSSCVKRGVDVRIIYDDVGSITKLPSGFVKKLEAAGIKCRVFNPFIPVLSARQNNRDHRKIAVMDGKVAYTGGINIADEYINEIERFGHWKDNAIRVEGDAAWSFTVMFLSMWDYLDPHEMGVENYSLYRPETLGIHPGGCIVQPYTDDPLDNEPVGDTIYCNMLGRANDYVYITTPYLIIDYTMEQALINAAKSGVDVRIITPGIPDKKYANEMTKSNYLRLIQGGVRIYEYTPGFIHAKTFICDDKFTTVGSVNLDYRSLYLHFECGAWVYDSDFAEVVKRDFLETQAMCRLITKEDCRVGFIRRLCREVLTVFAPLM